jgi:transposase
LAEVERHVSTLYASLELSQSTWLVTSLSPGSTTMSKHSISAGEGAGLLGLLARMRSKAELVAGAPVEIAVIQEAGLDGFWVHRLLDADSGNCGQVFRLIADTDSD